MKSDYENQLSSIYIYMYICACQDSHGMIMF